MRRLRKAPRLFGGGRRVAVRAQRVRRGPVPGLAPVTPWAGLNQSETRVAQALQTLRVRFTVQQNFMGGGILGGARADFVLPDYRIVLNHDGPFHQTSAGKSRDLLVNASYAASGYRVVATTEADLPRLTERLRELIGVPLGV